MKSHIKIALLLSCIYFICGNVIAHFYPENIIGLLFFPYIFVCGMSDFAGWSTMSYVTEVMIFLISIPIFIPFALFFDTTKVNRANR